MKNNLKNKKVICNRYKICSYAKTCNDSKPHLYEDNLFKKCPFVSNAILIEFKKK